MSKAVSYRCSFCGKPQEKVKRLIAGPGAVFICNECVALCQEIIDEEIAGPPSRQLPAQEGETKKEGN